ncbi:MAG: acetyl CoA synthetase [Thermoprotei archaeon]|nr:MAG: acetyl CoA synthetase [Thermoprotei archaeon]RLF20141.1 MAG: acetyl CoA synthetase [Thermoprotei archaeon]
MSQGSGEHQLKYMFYPKSVAVIGASRKPGKIGHEILRNLIEYGYPGKIYPVNPSADEILGLKCYKSVLEIPDEVDLAVISVPAKFVPEVLEQCGKKGVKAVAVISAGFGEIGNVDLERKIVEIARKYNMRLLGPNIFGLVYTPSKLNASFGPRDVLPGNIAFISQSGALGIALMGWTILEEIGLSAVVSVGNKADIEDADLLEFFGKDEHTKVILIYMEGVKDGRKFMKVAREVSKRKPIVVIKAGRSERGAKAAASHTGSLAGSDRVYDAAFKQCGVLRANNFEEAFDWARALAILPPPSGENVVIITNGGGAGVLATDACEAYGLKLLEMPKDLEDKFRKYMPAFGSPHNPIDLTGQASEEQYKGALLEALNEPRIHSIILLYCQTIITDPEALADAIIEAYTQAKVKKPIVVNFVGGVECDRAMRKMEKAGIPTYPTPERAVSALAALHRWARYAGYIKQT